MIASRALAPAGGSRTGRPSRANSRPAARICSAAPCAWASSTKPPRSRPRTLAWTTIRRLPFSRLIWFGPSAVSKRATEESGTGAASPPGVLRHDRQLGHHGGIACGPRRRAGRRRRSGGRLRAHGPPRGRPARSTARRRRRWHGRPSAAAAVRSTRGGDGRLAADLLDPHVRRAVDPAQDRGDPVGLRAQHVAKSSP